MDRYPEAPGVGFRSKRRGSDGTAIDELPDDIAYRSLQAQTVYTFQVDHPYLEEDEKAAIENHYQAWKAAGRPWFEFVWPPESEAGGVYLVKYLIDGPPDINAEGGGVWSGSLVLRGTKQ